MRDRQWIYTGIWRDSWFAELDMMVQLTFIYLLTNPKIGFSGIFELTDRDVAIDLGIERDDALQYMERIAQDGRLQFDGERNLVWVVNRWKWCTYDNKSPSFHISARKELDRYQGSPLVDAFQERYTLSVPYTPPPHPSHLPGTWDAPIDDVGYTSPQEARAGTRPGKREHAPGHARIAPADQRATTSPQENRSEVKNSQPPRSPASADSHTRDEIFEALCTATGVDFTANMTKSQRGRMNAVAKQLREIEASPSEIARRAHQYRRHHPDWPLTPTALVHHWDDSELAPSRKHSVPVTDNGDLEVEVEDDEPVDHKAQLAEIKKLREAMIKTDGEGDNDEG